MLDALPRMYTEFADWFHLITAPEEYAEEADFYLRTMAAAADAPLRTLLELGSGGGNNASHYKRHVEATLTDLSPGMLELSRRLNPECEHIQGDMRSLRLGRLFDAVLVHDAVSYLTNEADVRRTMTTAFVHCRPGGVALFCPDHVCENFPNANPERSTEHGGTDGQGRAVRWLEWTFDPDPTDSTYVAEFVYILHEDGQPTRSAFDRHVCGLFSRDDWLRLLTEVGFVEASVKPFDHTELPPGSLEVFVATRPC